MESEANQDTYGSYLKDFRLKKNLTIETIARKTRIARHCLRAMEQNDPDGLPPRAYVKSFIRAYADAVGANADVALDLYLSDIERRAVATQQILKRRAKLGALRRVLMAVGVVAGIVLLVRYSNLFPDFASSPGNPNPPQHRALPEPSATAAETGASRAAGTKTEQKLKLKVMAVERTWLKVIVDNQNARSYHLKPEDRLELEGTDNFNLMIGNAAGVQIFLNGRPVKIFGKKDQVVSLKIP